MKERGFGVLVFVFMLTVSQSLWAQGVGSREQARASFERGLQLVEAERWEDALEAFNESLRVYPTQSATFNRALCLGLMGRPSDAVRALEDYRRQFTGQISAERQTEVDQELSSLRSRIGRIDVRIQGTESASVLLNGEAAGDAPLAHPIAVNPGRHNVTVQAEGFNPVSRWVEVGAGDVISLVVALDRGESTEERVSVGPDGSVQRVEVTPPTTPPETPTPPQRNQGLMIGGWVSAGVAVAALSAALGLFLWNNSEYSDWETERSAIQAAYSETESEPQDHTLLGDRLSDHNEQGESIETIDAVSWAMLGVGLAATSAAVALLVLGFRSGRAPNVAIAPQPGGMSFSIGWAFR